MIKDLFKNKIFSFLILSCILLFVRIVFMGFDKFVYMYWNIFLAFIPLIVTYFAFYFNILNKFLLSFLLFVWIIFLPNAPYLVTDLIHISRGNTLYTYYDCAMFFTCAYLGLVLFTKSIFYYEKILQKLSFSKTYIEFSIFVALLLSSLGVYLGRFLRFNSWDIIHKQSHIYQSIKDIIFISPEHKNAYLFILVFFVFLAVFYSYTRQD